MLAMIIVLAPSMASAVLVEALDFTDGGAWTITVKDAGYPYTLELDGNPTKVGYATNTDSTGGVMFVQEILAPAGFAMSNIRLEALISGFSSWIMLGRIGLGNAPADAVAEMPYWTGSDHMSGVVTTDEPMSVDASGDPDFTDVTRVIVATEVWKGLSWVYQRPDVSQIKLYADLTALPVIPAVDFTKPLTADEFTLGLWHFDQQTDDTNVDDASGNGNDGIWAQNPRWESSRAGFDTCARPFYGSSTNYSGNITVPNGSNTLGIGSDSDLTIECWVKPEYVNAWRVLVAMHQGADYELAVDAGYPVFSYYSITGWVNYWDTQALVANTWTHLAVIVDRTSDPDVDTIRFFHNGVLSTEHHAPAALGLTYQDQPVYMFTNEGGYYGWFGWFDELRISSVIRPYGGFPGVLPLSINWIKLAGNDVQLGFNSAKDKVYKIKAADNMKNGPWNTVQTVFGQAGQTVITVVDALTGSSKEFYRVEKADRFFEDVTVEMGLGSLGTKPGWGSYPAWAASWGDYNNDGYVDLYCRELWQNNSGNSFTKMAIIPATAGHSGIWGDYDNDGFLDLYTFGSDQPPYVIGRLLRNVDGTSFVDVTQTSLPALPMTVPAPGCWGDFDGDGKLDLYLSGGEDPGYQPDAILWNNGDGTFSLDTKTTGQPARGVTAADFDNDNDMDIYVSHYRLEPNILWRNDGYRNFNDKAFEYGVSGVAHTIGSSWGDLDSDGYLDLFVGNFSHFGQQTPRFLKNIGSVSYYFQDNSAIANLTWRESYATPALGDFDNDSDLDIFLTSVATNNPNDESVLLRNDGGWTFAEVVSENIVKYANYQSTWADYDNDGDLDLLTANRLFRNPGNTNHWLKVKLIGNGTTVNKAAIGAKVLIDLGGGTKLIRQVEGATGEGNQNDLTLHFGLGSHSSNVNLNITWPNGSTQVVNTAVDQLVTVTQ